MSARRRSTSVGLTLAGITLIALGACSARQAGPEDRDEQALLASVTAEGDAGTLDLTHGFPRDWDRYEVVCPYTTATDLERRFGQKPPKLPDMSDSEDVQAVVLLDDKNSVRQTIVSDRAQMDLCSGDTNLSGRRGDEIALHRSEGFWVST